VLFPRKTTRLPATETSEELRVGDVVLRGWVANPGAPRAVVYFGGNAAQIGEARERFATHLPHHATYLFAYRGYGASEGSPSEKALVADGCRVVDEANRCHPGEEIAIWGRSLGAAVAMQVAARCPDVARLVLVTPFESAVAMARDHAGRLLSALIADRFDALDVANRLTMPTLVLRAGKDTVVLPQRTDALLSALPGEVKVVDFPEADHATVSDEPTYWPTVTSFLT